MHSGPKSTVQENNRFILSIRILAERGVSGDDPNVRWLPRRRVPDRHLVDDPFPTSLFDLCTPQQSRLVGFLLSIVPAVPARCVVAAVPNNVRRVDLADPTMLWANGLKRWVSPSVHGVQCLIDRGEDFKQLGSLPRGQCSLNRTAARGHQTERDV